MVSFKLGFHPPEALALTVVMWHPALLSFAARLLDKEGFYDVGWQLGRFRYWMLAALLPPLLALISYMLALDMHKVRMVDDLRPQPMLQAVFFNLHWFAPRASEWGLLAQRLLAVGLIGILPNFFFALGEEFGWRGYLLQRMIKARYRHPILWTSAFWAVWHLPLLLLTGYGHGVLSLLLHTLLIVLVGVFICWLRLASGSIWVATMAHASFNAFVQGFFGTTFTGDTSWAWAGDYGILTILPYSLLVAWLYHRGKLRTLPWSRKPAPTRSPIPVG
jgi:uncharacterized protein